MHQAYKILPLQDKSKMSCAKHIELELMSGKHPKRHYDIQYHPKMPHLEYLNFNTLYRQQGNDEQKTNIDKKHNQCLLKYRWFPHYKP